MYRCELCGVVVPPRSKMMTVVTEKREKVYAPQQRKHHGKAKGRNKRQRDVELPGGRGWEIVKESTACNACIDRYVTSET